MKFTIFPKKSDHKNPTDPVASIVNDKTPQDDDTNYRRVSNRELWNVSKWVFLFVFKHEPFYVTVSTLSWTFVQLNYIVNSFIFAKVIDRLISLSGSTGATIVDMYPYMAVLIGYNLVNKFVQWVSSYSDVAIRFSLRPKISQAFYKRLGYLGIQTLEQPKVNDRIYRADEYLNDIYPYITELTELISNIVILIITLVLFLKFFPVFVPLAVFFTIPYFLNDRKYRAQNYKFMFSNTQDLRKASYTSSDLRAPVKLGEISIVKGTGFLDDKYIKYASWYEKQRVMLMKKWRGLNTLYSSLTDVVTYGGYVVTFSQLIKGLISIGDVTFRLNIISRFQGNLTSALKTINNISEMAVRVREVYYIFTLEPSSPDGKVEFPVLPNGPEISINKVSFSYNNSDKLVLKDLSINIKSGEKIAIVGHNGAGKTTLVKLLCKIYQPTSGIVKVNNHNLMDLKTDSWYKNVGVLFQDFNMYPQLTVRENIQMGNPNEPVDELALRLAAQSADALQFIEEFPNKFDQILSEKFKGGIRPSTGQWQKLAIARFFYRNAPFVIFDEPTASIDAVSEYNIFNTIYDFFKGKTVIIISHRFSTVRNADRIIVLDHGQIIEEGTHNDLMSRNDYYAKAFNLQAKGYSSGCE